MILTDRGLKQKPFTSQFRGRESEVQALAFSAPGESLFLSYRQQPVLCPHVVERGTE